ncbi:hypothetical protein D3C86_2210780 [compost metagenome]
MAVLGALAHQVGLDDLGDQADPNATGSLFGRQVLSQGRLGQIAHASEQIQLE